MLGDNIVYTRNKGMKDLQSIADLSIYYIQWDLHYPNSFVPVQFKICSDNWICSDEWNQWSHIMLWTCTCTLTEHTYCYVQCTLYTIIVQLHCFN